MIKLLVRFAAWLDTRFPAKVTVTLEDYGRIDDKIRWAGERAAELEKSTDERFLVIVDSCARTNARLDKLDESVKALKEALTKASQPAVVADKRRADFVATGRFD